MRASNPLRCSVPDTPKEELGRRQSSFKSRAWCYCLGVRLVGTEDCQNTKPLVQRAAGIRRSAPRRRS